MKSAPITHINLSISVDLKRVNRDGPESGGLICELVTEREGRPDIYHTLTGVDARSVLAAALPALEQANERSLDESLGAIHYVSTSGSVDGIHMGLDLASGPDVSATFATMIPLEADVDFINESGKRDGIIRNTSIENGWLVYQHIPDEGVSDKVVRCKIGSDTHRALSKGTFVQFRELKAGPEIATLDSTTDISGQMREASAKMNGAASRLRDAGRTASAKAMKAFGRLQLFPAGERPEPVVEKYGRITPENFGGNVKPAPADDVRPPERPAPRPVGMVGEQGGEYVMAKPIPASVISNALKTAKHRGPIAASISSIDFGGTTADSPAAK